MHSKSRQTIHARGLAAALLLALGGCANDDGGGDSPKPIASNCESDNDCTTQKQPLEKIDAVDILLVIDNSPSIVTAAAALKAQLPRMMNAIVNGNDEDSSFPAASSVHVAVVSSDMGLPGITNIQNCSGHGDDGVFLKPGDVGVACDVSYPGYLAFEGGPAAVATVDGVGCLPLPVESVPDGIGPDGCGFEQPLEAALKALWPASDPAVSFLADMDGQGDKGHGDEENAGFLREDSLLVVIIVSDEDDCSSGDPSIFIPPQELDEDDGLAEIGLNTRCALNEDSLYPHSRYLEGLRKLRSDHPERMIFGVLAGLPPETVSTEALAAVDFEDDQARDAFYESVLDHDHMQLVIDEAESPGPEDDRLRPSCITDSATGYPPRRLVQTAQQFGAQSVLGSICAEDFGATTGMLIRAIGERLTQAASEPDAG